MPNADRQRTKFDSTQLKRMVAVGRVGPNSARIWMRSDSSGEVQVIVHPQEQPEEEKVVNVTIDSEETDRTQTALIRGLKPLTRYLFRVVRTSDGKTIGRGQFETFPQDADSTPDKISIALMSCHQPFNDDNELSNRRMRLLKVVPDILADYDVKFILLAGDQIYSDSPPDRSLFSRHYTGFWNNVAGQSILQWNADDVRRAYQERYRIFFAMRDVQHFYANYPCFPILDDHEIVDDWGAVKEHRSREFRNLRKGAREAYFDYQGSLVQNRLQRLRRSFHYSFDYGNVGVFVLDIRSQRRAGDNARLFGTPQLTDFETFLTRNTDKRVLIVMSSVPVVHLPEWLVEVGGAILGHAVDFPDHWSYGKNKEERDRFLRLIYNHQVQNPQQKVIIVSGDVHIGCAFAIHWQGSGVQPTLYQFTSSAISNRTKKLKTEILKLAPGMASKINCEDGLKAKTPLLEALDPEKHAQNPFGGLNIGIIEIEKGHDASAVTLKLVGYPEEGYYEHEEFFVSRKI